MPTTPRAISGSPPTAWWRSARKSRFARSRFDCLLRAWEPLPVGHVAPRPGNLPLGVAPRLGLRLDLRLFKPARAGEIVPNLAHPVGTLGRKSAVEPEAKQSIYLHERTRLDHALETGI